MNDPLVDGTRSLSDMVEVTVNGSIDPARRFRASLGSMEGRIAVGLWIQ